MHSLDPLVSFAGGEWAPTLDARTDLAEYRTACRQLRNMIPTKQGGATRRPGTQFIASGHLPKLGSGYPVVSRLISFQYAPGTTYMLELGDYGIRFYSNGAQVQAVPIPWVSGTSYAAGAFVSDGGVTYYAYNGAVINSTTHPSADSADWRPQTSYEVPSPYPAGYTPGQSPWSAAVWGVQFKQINDVMYLAHPQYPVWKLTRYADSPPNWVMQQVQFLTPALLDQNSTDTTITATATTGTGVGLTASAPAWVTGNYYTPANSVLQGGVIYNCTQIHTSGTFATDLANGLWTAVNIFAASGNQAVGTYYQLAYNRPTSDSPIALTADITSAPLLLIGTWEVQTYGTWAGTISLQVSYDGGSTWQVITTLTSDGDANFDITGQDIAGGLYQLVYTNSGSPTSATPPRADLVADNQFVYGLVQITAVADVYHATCTVITPLFSTGPTTFWSEGAWSLNRGFPTAIAVFQERVWYGGTMYQPQRVWATQTDDIENFALVDQSQATYGLAFDLNAPGRGPIQWLNAQTDLFVGLAGAEWVLTSGQSNAAITPTQIIALEHSANGSAPGLPGEIIGNACFYVQRRGTVFEQMLFSIFTNKYMSQDMQFLAQHLTSAGVKQFDFQQQFENQSIIWAVCGDGSLISMTYALEQKVFGWSKHSTGQALVNAGAFQTGQAYVISYVGTTDFTAIGAVSNQVGVSFTATGAGSGTGQGAASLDFGFISVQVIEGGNDADDEVWVSVYRQGAVVGSPPYPYCTIERIDPTDWQTANAGQPQVNLMNYADCSITVTSPPTGNEITGIPLFLVGRTVVASISPAGTNSAFAVRNLVVLSGGIVIIPNYVPKTGDVVVIGLPIPWTLQPMRLDVDPRTGEIPIVNKAISRLYPRVLNSIGGFWGTRQGELIPLPVFPITQNSNQPPPFAPGVPIDIECDTAALTQYDKDPWFVFTGTDPLPMTILGIFIEYDLGVPR